jgi:hypothetical protein
MATVDAAGFVERFARMWSAPDPERFGELWDAEGTLHHPSMAEPIPQPMIPDYLRRIQAMLPDISLRVLNWAAGEDFVLIEWEITATFQGEPMSWRGADRFTLRGDRAIEGVANFDTHPLWIAIDPQLDRGPLENVTVGAA